MTKTKETEKAEDIAGRGNLAKSLGTEVLNARTDNPFRIFQSDKFGSVRTATMQGRHYFAATDVATALGYKVPEKAIRTHCKGVSVLDTPSAGGMQRVNYISEPDLYRLVIRSKLPAAEEFADWVFEDVLPAINRTGIYVKAQPKAEPPRSIDRFELDHIVCQVAQRVTRMLNLDIIKASIYGLECRCEETERRLDSVAPRPKITIDEKGKSLIIPLELIRR